MTTHLPVAFFQIRGLAQSREAAKKTNFRVDNPDAIWQPLSDEVVIGNSRRYRQLTLFPCRDAPAQLVEEV
jgi:hypothetical protein